MTKYKNIQLNHKNKKNISSYIINKKLENTHYITVPYNYTSKNQKKKLEKHTKNKIGKK